MNQVSISGRTGKNVKKKNVNKISLYMFDGLVYYKGNFQFELSLQHGRVAITLCYGCYFSPGMSRSSQDSKFVGLQKRVNRELFKKISCSCCDCCSRCFPCEKDRLLQSCREWVELVCQEWFEHRVRTENKTRTAQSCCQVCVCSGWPWATNSSRRLLTFFYFYFLIPLALTYAYRFYL